MLSLNAKALCGAALLLFASCLTYLPSLNTPAAFYWDENFHIASAQRYLNGVFFMEPHPPLGKLLIAAGELLLDANSNDSSFLSQEYAGDPPDGFSFTGYRLFPVLCGALLAPTLYLLIFYLSRSLSISALTGMLPIFDNALIVHSRGAMLDPALLLCILLGLLSYRLAIKCSASSTGWCLAFGVTCGAALTVKINGGILLLFLAHLLFKHRRSLSHILSLVVPVVATFLIVWWIHFALGKTINPQLPDRGLFEVSDSFAQKVRSGESRSLSSLIYGISEAMRFAAHYQSGVPRLDLCKEDENGSTPLLWPIGARTINYRWESIGDLTRYLYLVPNPISWALGGVGVVGSLLHLFGSFRRSPTSLPVHHRTFTLLLLVAYLFCWLSPYLIPRVFYLYHYFVPLLFSWILFGILVTHYVSGASMIIQLLLALSVTGGYLWLSPLTYYLPITRQQLESRALLGAWDLRHQSVPSRHLSSCRNLESTQRRTSKQWSIVIGGLAANYIEQGVGTPQQLPEGFVVMTDSRIQFPLNRKFSLFRGAVSLEPSHSDSDTIVEIKLDGRSVWRKSLLPGSSNVIDFLVSTAGAGVLTVESKATSSSTITSTVYWERLTLL